MKTIREILKEKNSTIWCIKPTDSVFAAIQIMDEHQIGALLVQEGDKLVGIISERDYARKVILKGKSSKNTQVQEIMTRQVIYVSPSQTMEECMALMTEKRIRHLPVLEEGKLMGIISIGDAVKAAITEKEFLIDQLTKYISGG